MTMPPPDAPTGRTRWSSTRLLSVAVLLGAIAAGLVAVYGIDGLLRNGTTTSADATTCRGAVAEAKRIEPFVRGELAALAPADSPRRLPDLEFLGNDGKPVQLADFRGRVVLINLWATWCVPCRKEMPALDELERELGGSDFTVVAINVDSGERADPRGFLKEIDVQHLAYYEDRNLGVFQELRRIGRAIGLPTSILVDREGCELGVLAGPAEWGSEDAFALVRAAIGN